MWLRVVEGETGRGDGEGDAFLGNKGSLLTLHLRGGGGGRGLKSCGDRRRAFTSSTRINLVFD